MSPPSIENGSSLAIECSLSGLKNKTPNCATFSQRLLGGAIKVEHLEHITFLQKWALYYDLNALILFLLHFMLNN